MYGLMLAIFILCMCYYMFSLLAFICALFRAMESMSYGVSYSWTIPWTHFISFAVVVLATISSAMYCFGGIR